ncbi:TPA: hypothetical protein LA462_002351 [Clostridium botulinum]|nr:hypothetical protein [Clostridium botulinum]
MFNLDLRVFEFIYSKCTSLGNTIGFGAFEGFILYTGLILLIIIKVTTKKVK